ncbi:MAG: excinuclease ABC subunit UvrC [Acholeplasmatales bacterium]|jgi:excinuclease ABC subunit C|nr:excinuclease ABC subunit UvrC [Acholeplasmatales bacterium]
MEELIVEKLRTIPNSPGCYLMKAKDGKVIYVGKAKNLYNRVHSYFTGVHTGKTYLLVNEVKDFSYIVTNSNKEAFILELNLIKEYNPHYNILLIDDKTYPYICLSKEKYPVCYISRKRNKKDKYFGPYPDVTKARETLEIIKNVFHFRKCIKIPKTTCLYYDIGLCLAPCINKDVDYSEEISKLSSFLKGNNTTILQDLTLKMETYSKNLEFEKALEYKKMIESIKASVEKQIISLSDNKDRDFIGYVYEAGDLAINILIMRGGKIIGNHFEVQFYYLDYLDTLITYLETYYSGLKPDEIVVDEEIGHQEFIDLNNYMVVPVKGTKKEILNLSFENAKVSLKNNRQLSVNKSERTKKAVQELEEIVGTEVDRIDIFDNAQLFGTAQVSAMVVFKNRELRKELYRKYKISSRKNDDLDAMREVIYRRYQRMLFEKSEVPSLILVDGAENQINVCIGILRDLNLNIKVAGLKKNEMHKLTSLVYEEREYKLDIHQELFRFLLSLSEEVHRFAITYHKNVRSVELKKSFLDGIEGIGPNRKKALLTYFKNLDEMKNAEIEEFMKLRIPEEVAIRLKRVLECVK